MISCAQCGAPDDGWFAIVPDTNDEDMWLCKNCLNDAVLEEMDD
jgi:hypothetical protein